MEDSDAISFNATLESPLASSLTLWLSLDTAWTFTSYNMPRSGTGYTVTVPLDCSRYSLDNIIYFVEWDIVPSVGYSLSSNPYVPAGLNPRVRPAEPPDAVTSDTHAAHSAPPTIFPNPATSFVRIDRQVSQADVYSIDGRLVKRLNGAVWDCRDGKGRDVSPGVYLISVERSGKRFLRPVAVIR